MELINSTIKPITVDTTIQPKVIESERPANVPSVSLSSIKNNDVNTNVQQPLIRSVDDIEDIKSANPSADGEQLQQAVSQINDYVQTLQRDIQFTVDEKSGRDIVTVRDTETEEVIRQYPSEEVLAFAEQLSLQQDDNINLFNSQI